MRGAAAVFTIIAVCGAIWTRGFFNYFVPFEDRPSKFALIATRLIFVLFVIQGVLYLINHWR